MAEGIKKRLIGVIGTGTCDGSLADTAFETGRLIALHGYGLVNGGLGGVMEASARGCRSEGGLTVGILPGLEVSAANAFMEILIPTGLGDIRNLMIVRASAALIAVGGEYGTLSEIALGLKAGKSVIGLNTWDIRGVQPADSAQDALRLAVEAMNKNKEL